MHRGKGKTKTTKNQTKPTKNTTTTQKTHHSKKKHHCTPVVSFRWSLRNNCGPEDPAGSEEGRAVDWWRHSPPDVSLTLLKERFVQREIKVLFLEVSFFMEGNVMRQPCRLLLVGSMDSGSSLMDQVDSSFPINRDDGAILSFSIA